MRYLKSNFSSLHWAQYVPFFLSSQLITFIFVCLCTKSILVVMVWVGEFPTLLNLRMMSLCQMSSDLTETFFAHASIFDDINRFRNSFFCTCVSFWWCQQILLRGVLRRVSEARTWPWHFTVLCSIPFFYYPAIKRTSNLELLLEAFACAIDYLLLSVLIDVLRCEFIVNKMSQTHFQFLNFPE